MVECFIEHYDDEEQLLDEIATHNVQRTKGMETIAREALILKQEYSVEAQKRKLTGKKSDLVPDLGQGRTIDFVANSIKDKGFKISRNNVTVLIQAVEFIDNKSNLEIDVDVIRHELNRNKVSCNYSVLKFLLENVKTISEENKRKFISDDIDIKALKTEICKTQEITPSEDNLPKTPDELLKVINAFRKLPEYNNSTIRGIFAEIANNVQTIEKVNNVLNGEFKQMIQPILDLGVWKKIKYFSDRSTDCMVFTILKVFALVIGNGYGYYDDIGYDSSDDVDKELIELANNVVKIKYEKCTAKYETARKHQQQRIEDKKMRYNNGLQRTIQLFNQFNECICSYNGELFDNIQEFLDDCNTPHVVVALNKYHSLTKEYDLSSDRISYFNILYEFINSDDKEGYDYDMDYEAYSNSNVLNRQESIEDFITNYIDDYNNEISEEEEDNNE